MEQQQIKVSAALAGALREAGIDPATVLRRAGLSPAFWAEGGGLAAPG